MGLPISNRFGNIRSKNGIFSYIFTRATLLLLLFSNSTTKPRITLAVVNILVNYR